MNMQFLSPAGLALLALAIPILLLYMLKLRRKQVQVSSTMLWEQLLRDQQANTPWQKLKRNLLLFLQLLILLVLVLAFMRPAIQSPLTASGSVIILLDASASMNATDVTPSRFDVARRFTLAQVNNLPEGSQTTLILVGDTPRVLASAEADKSRLRGALENAAPSNGEADWQAAFALAAGAAQANRQATTVIISDGGLPESGLPALPGEVRFIPVGATDDNLAITALSLRARQMFVEVTNFGVRDRSVLLSIYLSDVLLTARQLQIPAGERRGFTLENLSDTPGIYRARITALQNDAPLDALALDDSAYAVYKTSSTRRVLLVSQGNLYLEQLLASLPNIQPFRALPGADGVPVIPQDPFDLYIFDGIASPQLPNGNLLFVNSPGNPLFEAGSVFQDMKNMQVMESPLTRFVNWSNVHILQARLVQPPDWATVLITAEAGPLVFAGEAENRRIAAVTFDLRESDLPLQVAYPILFSNLINYLVPPAAFDASRALQPGESLSIAVPPGTRQVIVASPENIAYPYVPTTPTLSFTETGELGFYAVNFITADTSTFEYFSVNLFSPAESDIRPRDSIQVGRATILPSGAEQKGQREIWQWFAAFALVVLLVEWQVYHRRQITNLPVIKALSFLWQKFAAPAGKNNLPGSQNSKGGAG